MLAETLQRVEELTRAIEQAAANYNSLVGSLQEAKRFYEALVDKEPQVELSSSTDAPIDAEFVDSQVQDVVQ